jgi:hypothetical protein
MGQEKMVRCYLNASPRSIDRNTCAQVAEVQPAIRGIGLLDYPNGSKFPCG